MTKKKFAELELSLLHLQQNVEIPETNLIIHPVIQRAVEQVNLIALWTKVTAYSSAGPSKWYKTKHLTHPSKTSQRQLFPQHSTRACQLMDQVYPSRY